MIDCEYEPSRFCSDPPSGFGKAKRTLAFSCVADRFCSDSRLLPSVKLFFPFCSKQNISIPGYSPCNQPRVTHLTLKEAPPFFPAKFFLRVFKWLSSILLNKFLCCEGYYIYIISTNILFYVDEYKSGAFWAKNFTIGRSDSWSGRLYEHVIMLKNII